MQFQLERIIIYPTIIKEKEMVSATVSVDKRSHTLIRPSSSAISWVERWDHILARCGYRRSTHKVEPGLYGLGSPTEQSPVFISANYTLSFDALRSALDGIDCYILILDTKGINVWCAAGKGTFGTEELVDRIQDTRLYEVVSHRVLIVPQLGAAGVAAHEVRKQTGFTVEYGPIQANDLQEYLKAHQATPQMRRVSFPLAGRLTLVPVELVHGLLPMLVVAVILYFIGGILSSVAGISTILAGVVLFPVLLPWLPTPNFSTKGLILGGVVSLPFALLTFLGKGEVLWWIRTIRALSFILPMMAATAFLALNFTGATTFTSRSGVKREIFRYIPVMAWLFVIGLLLLIGLTIVGRIGG